jgi:hypothetical protein
MWGASSQGLVGVVVVVDVVVAGVDVAPSLDRCVGRKAPDGEDSFRNKNKLITKKHHRLWQKI